MAAEPPRPRDEAILRLLHRRDGLATHILLDDGRRLTVFNIAWGYDLGDEYAHVTTNISPDTEGADIDFFFTDSIAAIIDPENGAVLHEAP